MAETGRKKVEYVARLFDPTKGYEPITTFATDAQEQAWRQQIARDDPDLLVVPCLSTPDPWEYSEHGRILEEVKATRKPIVYVTRPAREDDL